MLVFSTTSLQLSLISPSNPRALYFGEDMYLGRKLAEALNMDQPSAEYAYLPASEKRAIRIILQETLADLPRGW